METKQEQIFENIAKDVISIERYCFSKFISRSLIQLLMDITVLFLPMVRQVPVKPTQ